MSAPKAIAKIIKFTAQAHEHHNQIKIKHVLKCLKAGHEVRVLIAGSTDRQKAMESLYKELEKNVKTGARFLQKNVKPQSIKVVLMPTEDALNFEIDESTKSSTDVEAELREISGPNEDMFSSDFEEKLLKSIKEERSKNKKRH